MRVLIVRRQSFGGVATYTNLLADALDNYGVEAVVDDADEWIPDKTGWGIDRQVSKALHAAARGFDLVHAFGYRSAWACSQAFYVNSPWVYTAHDLSKTTHGELIDRLNAAKIGVCSSDANLSQLSQVETLNLSLIRPGINIRRKVIDREESREMMGVEKDEFFIVGAGVLSQDRSFDVLVEAKEKLVGNVRLFITGRGSQEEALKNLAGEKVTISHQLFDQQQAIAAADLVVVPHTRSGFSFTAAEAMHQGVPVLVRAQGGLTEMGEPDHSLFVFHANEGLARSIQRVIDEPEMAREIAECGQRAVAHSFDIERTAGEYAKAYFKAVAR